MKWNDISPKALNEYVIIGDDSHEIDSFAFNENDGPIGTIAVKGGAVYQVYCRRIGNEVMYGAIERQSGKPSEPSVIAGFLQMTGGPYIAKNAWTRSDEQKKGLASELMHFVIAVENNITLSDTMMTRAGVALWKSLATSGKFDIFVYNAETGIEYRADEIYNVNVIDPAMDNQSTTFWDGHSGQRWFYVMKRRHDVTLHEGVEHRYLPARENHIPARQLLNVIAHFGVGDE